MKKITVTLSPYKSPYYPVQAKWKINGIKYQTVFETVEQAKNYFSGRYLNYVTIREARI